MDEDLMIEEEMQAELRPAEERPVKKFRIDVNKLNEDIGTTEITDLKSIVTSGNSGSGGGTGEISLLGKSIQQLKLELHLEEQKKRKDAIETIQSEEYEIDSGLKSNAETQLWVEKFKPKDYFELLSDDGTNRLLLTWMKSWDYIVFGKEKNKDNGQHKMENKAKQQLENSGKKRKRGFNQIEAEMEEKILDLDEYNRPRVKVALISGPPGLGKTTLAHIIAKRAGYNIIEMNASDDRSVESFRQYIESVTQIRGSVNDANMKPSCLVIDEIDGAPQNSVQVLIDHVQESGKSSKKDKQKLTVLRPIICICNDLYAPSLRQLRPVSIVFQCFQVSSHRLAERLYNICNMSNLHCDMDAMVALCDKTSNDIRSALNTLQFLSKRTNRVTSKMVKELNIGQKDMEKSVFTLMNEIFFKKYETKKEAGKTDEPGSRFNTLVEMSQMCDLDRLLQGLYENFLFVRFRDSYFESVIKGGEWLLFCDRMSKQTRDSQDYSLLRYQRFIPPLFHMLYSSTNSQLNNQTKKLKYPSKQYEVHMSLTKNTRILTSFLNDMSPSTRMFYNSALYSTVDLLPQLTQIVQPNIRPVAIQLLTKSEKEKFDNLIKIMIAFNLVYRQEKGSDGQFNFVLEPAIEEVIKFSGLKQHKQLCYIIKQQISREIMLAKVKSIDRGKVERVEAQKSDTNLSSSPRSPGLRSLNVKDLHKSRAKEIEEKEKKDRENKEAAAAAKKKEAFSGGIQNFFTKLTVSKDSTKKGTSEAVNSSNVTTSSSKKSQNKLTDGIYLKYKEGFTNAVRYNIKISELL